jgi:competence protein ComEA
MLSQFCSLSPSSLSQRQVSFGASHFAKGIAHMFKQLFKRLFKHGSVALLALATGIGIAIAQVDVNKADPAALGSIKGIGPAMSSHILEARKKGGDFKDWSDLQERVSGIGPKSAARLSAAGLTVGGKNLGGAAAKPAAAKAPAKKAAG